MEEPRGWIQCRHMARCDTRTPRSLLPRAVFSVEQSEAFEPNGSCRVRGEGSVPSFSLFFFPSFFPPFFMCFI